MRRWLIGAGMLVAGTPALSQMPPAGVPARYCDASGLDDLIGLAGTSQLGVEALRRSHSGTMRWLRPGAVVTMDFRRDRLTIVTDKVNVVTGFKCG